MVTQILACTCLQTALHAAGQAQEPSGSGLHRDITSCLLESGDHLPIYLASLTNLTCCTAQAILEFPRQRGTLKILRIYRVCKGIMMALSGILKSLLEAKQQAARATHVSGLYVGTFYGKGCLHFGTDSSTSCHGTWIRFSRTHQSTP